jgi:hypothetical protein
MWFKELPSTMLSLRLRPALALSTIAFALVACASSSDEQLGAGDEASSLMPPQSPPVDRPEPGRPLPGGPTSPADALPTTPIVVPHGAVTRLSANATEIEMTTLDPGVGHTVSQPEASNICQRLSYGGETGWYLPDERTLLAMKGMTSVHAPVWSNVDFVMASGFTGVDPTSGETDLREMASTIDLGSGAFRSADHEFSDLGSKAHFVCIHTQSPIKDWHACLGQPSELLRCECLGVVFVPPRDHFECN